MTCLSPFGYTGASTWGYPVSQGHNCTNYAAFRLAQNGAKNPGNLGSALDWDKNAQAKGFRVDHNITPGAIVQWNEGEGMGDSGHVAYIDYVEGGRVYISESSYNRKVGERRVLPPSQIPRVIHIKDLLGTDIPPSNAFSASLPLPDFSGDGRADILGIDSAGLLWHYPHAASDAFGVRTQVGQGWAAYTSVMTADWSGDGVDDVLGVGPDGKLRYWAHWKYSGVDTFANPIEIGIGWDAMVQVMAADWTGDRRADVLAIDSSGRLFLYPHGSGDSFLDRVQIGQGWQVMRLATAEDVSGDGRADILAVDQAGDLWYYEHGAGNTFLARVQVGHAWNSIRTIMAADWTGDHTADIIAVSDAGDMFVYPHWYDTTHGHYFSDKKLIGIEWDTWRIA